MTTFNTSTTAPGKVVDLRQFNPTGDGATDDAAAFTSALAAGNTVIVPDGDFAIHSAVVLQQGKIIRGSGPASIIRCYTSAGVISLTGGSQAGLEDLMVIGCTTGGLATVQTTGLTNATAVNCITIDKRNCYLRNVLGYNATTAALNIGTDADGLSVDSCRFGYCNGGASVGDAVVVGSPVSFTNTIIGNSNGRAMYNTGRVTYIGGRVAFSRLGLVETDGSVEGNALFTSHGTFFENAGIQGDGETPLQGGGAPDVWNFYVHDGDGANGYAHIAIDSPQQLQMGYADHLALQESGGHFALTGKTQITGVVNPSTSDRVEVFQLEDDCQLTLGSIYSGDWSRFSATAGQRWTQITPRAGSWAIDAHPVETRLLVDGSDATTGWTAHNATLATDATVTNTVTAGSSIKLTGSGAAENNASYFTLTGANNDLEGTEGRLIIVRCVMKGEEAGTQNLKMSLRLIGTGVVVSDLSTPTITVEGVWYYFEQMAYVSDATQDLAIYFAVNSGSDASNDIVYLDRAELLIL